MPDWLRGASLGFTILGAVHFFCAQFDLAAIAACVALSLMWIAFHGETK